ncbi:putative MAP kinase kinase [Paratrimastix pyriformis]|uniref:mitogen-activated protein kinase kinase n=1 Tax=Paratrimastix pyriformis TaxID=342808 RepID=A0ABQ8ULM3_9EUKA|nr:putative MAP kinase kinase [Paratrimastix pyriformis]
MLRSSLPIPMDSTPRPGVGLLLTSPLRSPARPAPNPQNPPPPPTPPPCLLVMGAVMGPPATALAHSCLDLLQSLALADPALPARPSSPPVPPPPPPAPAGPRLGPGVRCRAMAALLTVAPVLGGTAPALAARCLAAVGLLATGADGRALLRHALQCLGPAQPLGLLVTTLAAALPTLLALSTPSRLPPAQRALISALQAPAGPAILSHSNHNTTGNNSSSSSDPCRHCHPSPTRGPAGRLGGRSRAGRTGLVGTLDTPLDWVALPAPLSALWNALLLVQRSGLPLLHPRVWAMLDQTLSLWAPRRPPRRRPVCPRCGARMAPAAQSEAHWAGRLLRLLRGMTPDMPADVGPAPPQRPAAPLSLAGLLIPTAPATAPTAPRGQAPPLLPAPVGAAPTSITSAAQQQQQQQQQAQAQAAEDAALLYGDEDDDMAAMGIITPAAPAAVPAAAAPAVATPAATQATGTEAAASARVGGLPLGRGQKRARDSHQQQQGEGAGQAEPEAALPEGVDAHGPGEALAADQHEELAGQPPDGADDVHDDDGGGGDDDDVADEGEDEDEDDWLTDEEDADADEDETALLRSAEEQAACLLAPATPHPPTEWGQLPLGWSAQPWVGYRPALSPPQNVDPHLHLAWVALDRVAPARGGPDADPTGPPAWLEGVLPCEETATRLPHLAPALGTLAGLALGPAPGPGLQPQDAGGLLSTPASAVPPPVASANPQTAAAIAAAAAAAAAALERGRLGGAGPVMLPAAALAPMPTLITPVTGAPTMSRQQQHAQQKRLHAQQAHQAQAQQQQQQAQMAAQQQFQLLAARGLTPGLGISAPTAAQQLQQLQAQMINNLLAGGRRACCVCKQQDICPFSLPDPQQTKTTLYLTGPPDQAQWSSIYPLDETPETGLHAVMRFMPEVINATQKATGPRPSRFRKWHLGRSGESVEQEEEVEPKYALDTLERLELLGQGASGKIYRVRSRTTGEIFAMKIIPMDCSREVRRQINFEIRTLCRLSSPYIISCPDAFFSEGHLYILLEFMDGGSLLDLMEGTGAIPERQLARITKQVLYGLEYCKEQHLVHRDLKISDFGVSSRLEGTVAVAKTWVGTRATYAYEADIWALGLTLVELAQHRYPYPPPVSTPSSPSGSCSVRPSRPLPAPHYIVKEPVPTLPTDKFSPEFCDFIAQCLRKNGADRPTCQELLNLLYFSSALQTHAVFFSSSFLTRIPGTRKNTRLLIDWGWRCTCRLPDGFDRVKPAVLHGAPVEDSIRTPRVPLATGGLAASTYAAHAAHTGHHPHSFGLPIHEAPLSRNWRAPLTPEVLGVDEWGAKEWLALGD